MSTLIAHAAARLWIAALGLYLNNGPYPRFPNVLVPTCSSELSSVHAKVIAYTVIKPCSEAASLSGNKVKLGVSALPCCPAFVTALQLVGASSPKSYPTENTVLESKGL